MNLRLGADIGKRGPRRKPLYVVAVLAAGVGGVVAWVPETATPISVAAAVVGVAIPLFRRP